MKFTRELAGSLTIRSVTADAIRVNNDSYARPFALTPDAFLGDWPDVAIAELDETHFKRVLERQPEIVLLGTGQAHIFPPRELVFAFARRGIGFETMDSAAAARTFNVLATEGRRVAAVLYL